MSKQVADMDQKDSKRVPKPLMEKRRRDRINQSLETLRLLLLENTHNEKLMNPKVEKAEILESVVQFLRAEQKSGTDSYQITRGKRRRTEEYDGDLRSPCKRQSYSDGMRTCLLRVSQFISSKSHEFVDGSKKQCENLQHSPLEHTQLLSASSAHRETQMHLTYNDLAQKHLTLVQPAKSCTATVLSGPTMTSSPRQPVMLCDSVWRPWPQ